MLARSLRRSGALSHVPRRSSSLLTTRPQKRLYSDSSKPPPPPEPPKLSPKWLRELLGVNDLQGDLYEQAEGLLPYRIKTAYRKIVVMKHVGVVYGGAGALGQELIAQLKPLDYELVNIDFKKNEEAAHNIIVEGDPIKDRKKIMEWAAKFSGLDEKLSFVGCVAGGWAGGNVESDDVFATTQKMIDSSLYTSIIASQLAAKYMAFDGLLMFMGAAAALEPTPTMVGYGAAKAAVHHLSQSVAKAYYPRFDTITICPRTLDTRANREAMPNADQSTWTPLAHIAKRVVFWLGRRDLRELNGSLIVPETEKRQTVFLTAETKY